jgi:recombination protein RecT
MARQSAKKESKKNEVGQLAPIRSQSQRFTDMVVREFGQEIGTINLTNHQRRLAQHLFIKVDHALKALEADRVKKGQDKKTPIIWNNINMNKLAVDAVYRIELGLDALIPNHLHVVPYLNGKTGQYDLDLSVGYVGKDYYHREMAVEKPKDVIYSLVHETDVFVPIMRSVGSEGDNYEFEIKQPFNRGKVVGGFGYIIYSDPSKNKLVLVSENDFVKSKKAAPTNTIWEAHPEAMRFKTIVIKTVKHIPLDPKRLNAAYHHVETSEAERIEHMADTEAAEYANQGGVIDVEHETLPDARESDKTPDSGDDAQQGQAGKQEAQDEQQEQAEEAAPY